MTTTSRLNAELDLATTAETIRRLRHEVGKIVVGQHVVVEQMITALISRGHCLLIGVPGLAKTVMAKALADAMDMQFKRVQFTPDLMPSDITGTNVLQDDPQTGKKEFRFLPGPVFTNILLADEINRTPPKTQAALLEAMQEQRVTFGGERRQLPAPFFVLATQNPLEQEGTYPLPEAQLDRFMFSVAVTYPSHAEENQIVSATTEQLRHKPARVITVEEVLMMQRFVRESPTPPQIVRYAVALARATRPVDPSSPPFIKNYVETGAGPRAGQYLVLAAKARAVLMGRHSPTIEDVRAAAVPVLRHRMFTNFTALSENVTTDALVRQLIEKVAPQNDAKAIVYSPPTGDGTTVKLAPDADAMTLIKELRPIAQRIREEVRQTIVGQSGVIDLVLNALLAGGHCLLVGVPGLAKTTLVQTIAQVLDLDFKRVQFTPDLMPSDITGTDIMELDPTTGARQFRFIHGPVFTNLLLADEINRTPPKTQAALLESMQELSVTSGGTSYQLSPPFCVLATQNPLEQEGTYPLPEAQLDRFMFNIRLDYPTAEEEPIVVERTTGKGGQAPRKVINGADILRLQQLVRQVPISRHVLTYVTTLVRATRPETEGSSALVKKYVHCGAGPRACQFLVMGAKVRAILNGRANVSIADVKAVAVPVLHHRVFTNFAADAEGITPISLVETLLKEVAEPKADQEKLLEPTPASAARPASHVGGISAKPSAAAGGGTAGASGAAGAGAGSGGASHASHAGHPAITTPAAPPAEPDPEAVMVSCPGCHKPLRLPGRAKGKTVSCPSCKQVFKIAGD